MNTIEKLVSAEGSLSVAMREIWVIAHRIKAKELAEWARKELDGYGQGEEAPEYRRTESKVTAEFTDGYKILTQSILLGAIKGIEDAEVWDRPTFREGIEGLEALRGRDRLEVMNGGNLLMLHNEVFNSLMVAKGTMGDHPLNCLSVKVEVSGKAPEEILSRIRSKGIELLLELEAIDPALVGGSGEGVREIDEEKKSEARKRIKEWLAKLGEKAVEGVVTNSIVQGLGNL